MKPARIVALILGSLVALAGLLVLFSGGGLGLADLAQRNDGYLSADLADLESPTAAVTMERIDIDVDPGTPRWIIDALDTDVRIRASNIEPTPIYDDEPIDLTNHRPTDAERVAPGHGWSPYA